MLAAQRAKKEALEQALRKKTEELKELCLREAVSVYQRARYSGLIINSVHESQLNQLNFHPLIVVSPTANREKIVLKLNIAANFDVFIIFI